MAGKKQPPVLLIDADVFRYQMAFSNTVAIDWDGDGQTTDACQPDKARADVDSMIAELCQKFRTEDFLLPLSCKEHNFRKDVEPTYKQARHAKQKPALWSVIDDHLEDAYGDRIITRPTLEGDDILGLLATHPRPKRAPGPRIVVSIDKDLQTVPCRLYNPRKPDLGVRPIGIHDANLFWMHQVLTGDTTDNYTGCPGIGPKKADAALLPVHEALLGAPEGEHLEALWDAVIAVYASKGLKPEDAVIQARLARILRHGDYDHKTNKVNLWKP